MPFQWLWGAEWGWWDDFPEQLLATKHGGWIPHKIPLWPFETHTGKSEGLTTTHGGWTKQNDDTHLTHTQNPLLNFNQTMPNCHN